MAIRTRKFIVDTTLRDGEQSPSVNFTRQQKLDIASLLDAAGVSQIEAGIPASSGDEKQTICQIIHCCKHAKIAVWSRLALNDLQQCMDCGPDIIHISIPVSDIQIYSKLQKDRHWIIEQLFACLELLIDHHINVKHISIGFEDAFRADNEFLIRICKILLDFNIKRIRLADTVGTVFPSLCRKRFAELSEETGHWAHFGFHGHNDLGMSLANTIEALKCSCNYADTTLLGIGERTGNCDFQQLVCATQHLFDFGLTAETATDVQTEFLKIIHQAA
jgi:Isopropylmalate/homocitrate/citramalate synthases